MKTTRALLSGGPSDGRLVELNYPPMRYQFLQIPIMPPLDLRNVRSEMMEPPQILQATYRARGVDQNRTFGWHVLYEFVK